MPVISDIHPIRDILLFFVNEYLLLDFIKFKLNTSNTLKVLLDKYDLF